MTTATKDEVDTAALETRASEARTRLLELGDKLGDLQGKPEAERSDQWRAEMGDTVRMINAQDAQLTALERSIVRKPVDQGHGPSGATLEIRGDRPQTLGERFVASEGFDKWNSSQGSFASELRMSESEIRTIITSSTGDATAAGIWAPLASPNLNPRAVDELRLFIEDLIPHAPTTYNLIPYIRELSPRTNETGASGVVEGTAKPEVAMQFVRVDAPVRKIAAWVPVTDEILNDAASLRAYIDNRLRYMLRFRREAQILNGLGTAPDLLGILQSGVQTQGATSGDPAITLGNAIAKIELVDGTATGIVMYPTNYWTMVTRRTSTAGNFDGSNLPFGVGPNGAWGLPVVRTRAMTSGHALVGDFQQGAMIWDREEINVRVGDQHSDFFTNNKVAVLAECRLALQVDRPDYFVDATL